MFLPPIQTNGSHTNLMLRFGGLDLRDEPASGSLSAAENLSAAAYPALRPRNSRIKVLARNGISAAVKDPVAFTGIQNGEFYYQGERILHPQPLVGDALTEMNGSILIFPDKLYYNYLPDPVTGEKATTLKSMEKTLELSGVTLYSYEDSITGAYTAYLQKSGGGFDRFCEGESICIAGCQIPQNNTVSLESRTDFAPPDAIVSAVVQQATADRLTLLLYNKNGGKAHFTNTTETGSITVKVSIPDMNHVVVHNNRLWGTAANGETVHASKLGDFCNFYSFQGLADDSWYAAVATPGAFTGIAGYRTSVVALKQECIHQIYGDRPQNFSMPKQTMGGCIDGRSVVELQGVLYYLSSHGVYGYTGGEPYCVSQALPLRFAKGVGGTDGAAYYLGAECEDGTRHLLVYDPDKNLWQREDDTPFLQFLRTNGRFYGVCEDKILQFDAGEERVSWSMTTQPMHYDTLQFKGANGLRLLLDLEAESSVSVSVSHDGGEFIPCGGISSAGGRKSHRIPIRFRLCDSFRIRIEGQGKAVLHALELSVYQGGKTYAI